MIDGLNARVIRAPETRTEFLIRERRRSTGSSGRTTIQRNATQLGIGTVEVDWIGGGDDRDERHVGVCGGGGDFDGLAQFLMHERIWEMVAHLRNVNIKQCFYEFTASKHRQSEGERVRLEGKVS